MASDATPKLRLVIVHDMGFGPSAGAHGPAAASVRGSVAIICCKKRLGTTRGVGIVTNARLDKRQLWAMFGIAKHLQEQLAPVPLFVSSDRRT